MPKTERIGLTSHQVQNFIDDGFVKIENAFSSHLAEQCRDELWADIGLSPDEPENWIQPVIPYGDAGATLRQISASSYASTEDCEVELATGAAGTVYLCHPFLVHAAQAHRGERPRFMAQLPLLPRAEFDPALPPSPVQVAIRQACGLPL